MHLKLLRAAATVALIGGTATFGLGVQAAMATPTSVPCNTGVLITDMTSYTTGATLDLTPHCTYWVTAALPTVMKTLTIVGNNANVERGNTETAFSIFVVGCTDGDLTLDNVNVSGGGGEGIDGGAIHMDPGTVNVNGGTFSDNNVSQETEADGQGGAIYNMGGTLNVTDATFTGNSAYDGGAVYSESTDTSATLDHNTFSSNEAEYGGAIYGDDGYDADYAVAIGQGLFRSNNAEYGGAIYNEYNLTVNGNTLFTMNNANGEDGYGGAIYNDDATVNLTHTEIEINYAHVAGGGIYNDDSPDTVTLSDDLINENTPDNCAPAESIDGCVG